jgi:hypothetical protein
MLVLSYICCAKKQCKEGCLNNRNVSCYIRVSFVATKQRQNITSFVKIAYFAYLEIKLEDKANLELFFYV